MYIYEKRHPFGCLLFLLYHSLFIILLINDMADVKEFTKSKLKMLKKEHMATLASLIYNAEKSSIDAYNSKEVHN